MSTLIFSHQFIVANLRLGYCISFDSLEKAKAFCEERVKNYDLQCFQIFESQERITDVDAWKSGLLPSSINR